MRAYILRRLAFMIPTLLGIMLLNFIIVQAAPGGPVEQTIIRLTSLDANTSGNATARMSGEGSDLAARPEAATAGRQSFYRGGRGLDPEIITKIEKMYGFDKPPSERFFT